MLQAPQNLRDVAVISCAYHFKVKACFMLHADTRFSTQALGLSVNLITA